MLFDKDGTLIDYDHTWAPINRRVIEHAAGGDEALYARMCRGAGVDPKTGKADPESLFASGNTVEVAEFLVTEGSLFGRDDLTRRLDLLFQGAAETVLPLADLPRLFANLKTAGMVIGIASSDSEEAVLKTATFLNIERHIDFVCGYDSGHGVKPETGMVHAFCSATGTDVSRTAVVGDTRHDMVMARSAGAMAIGVLTGTGTRQSLSGYCDALIESVTDIMSAIE